MIYQDGSIYNGYFKALKRGKRWIIDNFNQRAVESIYSEVQIFNMRDFLKKIECMVKVN